MSDKTTQADSSVARPLFVIDPLKVPAAMRHGSPARVVEFDGRAGLNFTGIRGRLIVDQHTVAGPGGSMTMWVAPLDDIGIAPPHPHHAKSNPYFDKFVFISDREAMQDTDVAHFALYYHTWWHPGLIAKWAAGSYLDACYSLLRQRPAAGTGHFDFHRGHWYQLTLTWDRPAGHYAIFANGVKIASSDTFAAKLWDDPCGPALYVGNPALAVSTISFYNRALTPAEVRTTYDKEATKPYPGLAAELADIYEGARLPAFPPSADGDWRTRLNLPLTQPADYHAFFLQGCGTAASITPDGLSIRTPNFEESQRLGGVGNVNKFDTSKDLSRMYLWTRDTFEGDLSIRFDLKIRSHGGLALLMTQAAGMQREDFLQDYPLRTNGSMSTVFGEDVRNYHWEFYREMCDVRNDLVSHGLMKNPWYRPLAFQMENRRWDLDRWYRFEWLQEGSRLRAAVDGVAVINVTDSGFDNNGPVFTSGHVALRFMMRTDVLVKNLRIDTRAHFQTRTLDASTTA